MSEKRIVELCWIAILAFFALIIPHFFVPILAGVLIAATQDKTSPR